MLVDTHVHLYLPVFDDDREVVIDRARAAGVTRFVLPAIGLPSIHQSLDLCARHEGFHAMAALHPSETQTATDADFEVMAGLSTHPGIVAIGESGLDYYWDRSFDERQQHFLRQHIRLALARDLPLILHSRDRAGGEEVGRDLVQLLREEQAAAAHPDRLRGILHCFGGPAWLAAEAAALGFLVGIGGSLTFRNSGVDAVVRAVPLAQIVLETDAPYLAPVPYRGKRNEPAWLRLVAEKLAQVKGLSPDEVARITTENAVRLFGLS